ncbi:MAG: hypothetical protein M1837_001383 [Sclerophora amabilis]|nr:MAG: hypothetical protein M1837_001383 [Sclerophora amabilis]
MPLNYTAAPSSRISKPKAKNPLQRRSSSSPFASYPRRKSSQRSVRKNDTPVVDDSDQDDFEDRLADVGLIKSLATDLSLRDVAQAIRYIHDNMFSNVPERASGMNSTQTAEVLNFRRSLPPIVTITHIHALLNAPTTVEREIAELMRGRTIRKVVVPGRSAGGRGGVEGLVLTKDWERMVSNSSDIRDNAKDKFIKILHDHPTNLVLPRSLFSEEEATALMHAGFLTVANQSWTTATTLSSFGSGSSGTLTSLSRVGSQSASGSAAATGGEGAVHEAGGSGGGRAQSSRTATHAGQQGESGTVDKKLMGVGGDYNLSLPTTGPFLRLLAMARTHLLSLLSKSKYREATFDLLRERWDGGIAADDSAARRRDARGEFTGILPGRTRKWKQFYGLSFEWVLGECIGAGLVEVFETRSVGRGVRAT